VIKALNISKKELKKKPMNKFLFAAFLFVGTVNAQSSFSLSEAKQYGLDAHLSVKNAQLDIVKAKEQKKEYQAIGLPQVDISASFNNFINLPVQVVDAKFINPMAPDGETISFRAGTTYNSSATLQVNQLIFNGSYFIGVEAAKQIVNLQQTLLNQSQEEVLFNIIQAYQLVAVSKENVRFSDSMLRVTNQLIEKQKNYFELGLITQEDMDQLEYAKLTAMNTLTNADIQLNNALTLLKMTMFYPMEQSIDITETVDDLLLKVSLKDAGSVANNLTLQILQQQINLDELNIKNNKYAYLPTLAGYFQQGYNAFRNEFDFFSDKPWFSQTFWGLQLNVPVLSSGQRKARLEQTKIQKMKDENAFKIAENALKMQEIQAVNNLLGAQQKMNLQKENIRLAGKIYENSRIKEAIGKETSITVTQKYNQLMIAQAQYIGSLVDVFNAKLNLDKIYNQILK